MLNFCDCAVLETGCAENTRSFVELQNLLLVVSGRELFPGRRSLKWEWIGLWMATWGTKALLLLIILKEDFGSLACF